jgi:hypothetical protein
MSVIQLIDKQNIKHFHTNIDKGYSIEGSLSIKLNVSEMESNCITVTGQIVNAFSVIDQFYWDFFYLRLWHRYFID